MYHFIRTILISLIWISLIVVVPFAFFSWICYGGLCSGPAAEAVRRGVHYHIFGLYVLLYPIVVFVCLHYSRKLSQNHVMSLFLLLMPFICLIPLAKAEYKIRLIESNKIQVNEQSQYSNAMKTGLSNVTS